MIHQRALEYLLGLQGAALLRSFTEESDPGFGRARVAEMRRLLDRAELDVEPVAVERVSAVDGYRVWSRTYDEPGNGLFPPEEAAVHGILGGLPPGTAVDAACGTGRHSAWLAGQGHRVIGVDGSPEMLERARERVPSGEFHEAPLERLPIPDAHADIVVCSLALTHVRDLGPVFAEFARVLRPGGHLVVSDVARELAAIGSVPRVRVDGGRPALLVDHRHRASDYLGAALPAGLRVVSCAEPRMSPPVPLDTPAELPDTLETGVWDQWPWSLIGLTPEVCRAVTGDMPVLIIRHFRRDPDR
ncbi:class I SAM-dependent methyltransferase [Actinoplanes flavus]|uniref:Class I SAM-dependent methyltransferase n=1 Tax=Actinoplanes flavus TaxID=2820290 RepID=A0ABS3UHL6_9ACTN|nr:class I SAM-dependent methyltransferase [Actinoplanes flavus]MBO3737936.1 class I SAM-dependent methyltransferase [Actinoplanes flavus]